MPFSCYPCYNRCLHRTGSAISHIHEATKNRKGFVLSSILKLRCPRQTQQKGISSLKKHIIKNCSFAMQPREKKHKRNQSTNQVQKHRESSLAESQNITGKLHSSSWGRQFTERNFEVLKCNYISHQNNYELRNSSQM